MAPATYRLWSDTRGSWCDYEVVGEYYYIDNIQRLFPSAWNHDGDELFRDVELVPEPDNPYDEWAISVRADGRVLGHLKREDAPAWAAVIRRITASGLTAITNGRIYLYQSANWYDVDRHGNPRTETRARISIKLGSPELALPLNDPPAVPYTLVPRSAVVQVTKENEHFNTLFNSVPPSGHGLLYVTLHEDVVTTERTTKTVVGVRIDNEHVGQLTPQMSQRFLPMIQHLEARGLVTACQGDITGSSIAAEVRIDAVKANEADDTVLEGAAITQFVLTPSLENPRAYRIPAAYKADNAIDNTLRTPSSPAVAPPAPPVVNDQKAFRISRTYNGGTTTPRVPVAVPRTQPPPKHPRDLGGRDYSAGGTTGKSSAAWWTHAPALLVTTLIVAGFFSVLIPYVGGIVWLASWGTAIYIITQWLRMAARARNAERHHR
jgi:hypothetical protein